jgi:hypothetical protein
MVPTIRPPDCQQRSSFAWKNPGRIACFLDYLHFHSTPVGNDGRGIERVEQRWRGAVEGNKEVCRNGRIGGMSQHFRERKRALRDRGRGGKPSKTLMRPTLLAVPRR